MELVAPQLYCASSAGHPLLRACGLRRRALTLRLKRDLADIEGTYLNAGGHFWVATAADPETNDSVVVGTIALERKSETEGELRRLSIKTEYRWSGLGRQLIAHLEQWARAQHLKRITLTTGVVMKEAVAFYPKVGYTEIRRDFTAETEGYEIAHFLKQL